jgi:methionyl-tRNA synthetase
VRFYLTTAIDYVNSPPHLGTAYEKITADVIARHKRLAGVETRFLMGNDEHSQNVYRKAREAGLDPLEYCDRMEREFRDVWKTLDISFDDFIRTTESRHRAGVTTLVRRMAEAGDIYDGFYEGWYCISCEAFKQDKDLVDGFCEIHPTLKATWIKEKNYFFRLSKYRDRLVEHFRQHPQFLEPEIRRNEILRLLDSGLEDISVSRAGQAWGIPMPDDPRNVIYVWVDALINYASAVGLGTDDELFQTWWPADLHVVGKDITRFHSVIWPAMLMSARLSLPRQVFGHGWVHFKGERMSKSLGTVVDPWEAAARLGADPLRLYLVKEIAYGSDGDFTWERFEEKYNADLANNLGNLVNRLSAMSHRYRQGRLSSPGLPPGRLAAVADDVRRAYDHAMERYALHEAVSAAFRIVDAANEFIAEAEPWALAKDPGQADRLTSVLFDVAEALRIAALLFSPVMPRSSAEILRRVGETRPTGSLRLSDAAWKTDGERVITMAEPLWPRLESQKTEDSVTEHGGGRGSREAPAAKPASEPGVAPREQEQKQTSTPPAATPAPADNRITIDDFMKIELRVAKVLAAERVANSKKLIKLDVDVGSERRTLVAGIAEAYEAESLVGKSVAIVFNLKPAKLMGIESNGMVLAASPEGGKPILVTFEEAPAPGTRVR